MGCIVNSKEKIQRKSEQGFSLAELVIVMVVLGFLGVIVSRQFTGGVTNSAQAQSVIRTAEILQDNWFLLTQVAGAPLDPDPANNGMLVDSTDPDGGALRVLTYDGDGGVEADYKNAYQKASLAVFDDINWDSDQSEYRLFQYPIAMSTGQVNSIDYLQIEFDNVPERISKSVWEDVESIDFPSSPPNDLSSARRIIVDSGTDGGHKMTFHYRY